MHVWMKDIWKKPFSRVLSHDLHWENKTYKLKGSVSILLSVSSIFGGAVLINFAYTLQGSRLLEASAYEWLGALSSE